MNRRYTLFILLLLMCVALVSLLFALTVGGITLTVETVWQVLLGWEVDPLAVAVIHDLRLPRALAAFACGGLLALAGTLMQVLLRNPLADPYVLGISGGAAVGAIGVMSLGVASGLGIQVAACAGAITAMLLVFSLTHGDDGWSQSRLLLTGIVIAAGCGAAVALLLTLAPESTLRGMLFWLMGDAGQASDPLPAATTLVLGLGAALFYARDLNLLTHGPVLAASLGVHVHHLRWILYFLASLLTAAAVTTVGSVGFIGLVVPNLARQVLGNDQRLLLPAATLTGGILLTLADALARSVIAPRQLPVGVLTALLGVPLFLFILGRTPHGERG